MNMRALIAFTMLFILLSTSFAPVIAEDTALRSEPFTTGPSSLPVYPVKKVTFVSYDEETTVDDYAYLAAVPTAVFSTGDSLVSHPLLFYQDQLGSIDYEEEIFNARKGIDYFMDDWISYSAGLDQIIGIGATANDLSEWSAKTSTYYEMDDPIALSNELAEDNWQYSDTAVLSIIDTDTEIPENHTSNTVSGTLEASEILTIDTFDLEQTNQLNPVYHEFTVPSSYSYLTAECWWDCLFVFGQAVPTGDPDMHLYCRENGDWMEAGAVAQWNIYKPAGHEYIETHVYNSGTWRVGITDYPTESESTQKEFLGGLIGLQGNFLSALFGGVTYHVDVTLHPGITIPLPEQPPYGCRDVTIKLTWDNPNVQLGVSLIGPGGEVVATENNQTSTQEIELYQLGECLEGEHYHFNVFSADDLLDDINFEIEYSWDVGLSRDTGVSLSNAAEAAVLASTYNAPLLYTTKDTFDTQTQETLNLLGVTNIILVDIDDHLGEHLRQALENDYTITTHYTTLDAIYTDMYALTQSNDVIFTTLDPWTTWYVGALEPDEETIASHHIGPAAYLAAHHQAPVIPVELHEELSSAITWPTEFWRDYVSTRYEHIPPIADMYYTGMRVYDFLDAHGFDQVGRETMITVAGQYDIGIPWDRIFVGEALTGRFWGTPIDCANQISRNLFYPALIYTNPALSGQSITLINGSTSTRQGLLGLFKYPAFTSLVITRESQEESFTYPVLCSFVTHKYRFNERASTYYGSQYETADGLTPGVTSTLNPIDQGVMEAYTGETGAVFPDMTETEVIPFYLDKGGFDTAFSTELSSVVSNLNSGVILWVHASHGMQHEGGETLFWDPEEGFSGTLAGMYAGALKETNPWRGYDWYQGSTYEPDTMSMDIKGYVPFTHISLFPPMGMDWLPARRTVAEFFNKIIPFIDPFETEDLYDGLTGTIYYSKYPTAVKNASQIEENMENLHSSAFITSICQTSNTYFHLMMMRHGSVFQVQDPWPTSWYGAIWRQSIPRDIILGDTVGEAYVKGMSHVGILYIGDNGDPPQWWWDTAENVVYFGDPDLRMYVPENPYSDKNTWDKPDTVAYDEDLTVDGHSLYGTTSHPQERHPTTLMDRLLYVVIAIVALVVLAALSPLYRKKKGNKNEAPPAETSSAAPPKTKKTVAEKKAKTTTKSTTSSSKQTTKKTTTKKKTATKPKKKTTKK